MELIGQGGTFRGGNRGEVDTEGFGVCCPLFDVVLRLLARVEELADPLPVRAVWVVDAVADLVGDV